MLLLRHASAGVRLSSPEIDRNASSHARQSSARTVLSSAATAGARPGDVEAIAISASPCGGCRQWLHEWRLDRVTYRRANGDVVTHTVDEILPDSFDL